MPSSTWTRVVIFLTATLATVFAFLTGADVGAEALLKSVSAVSWAVVLLLLIYDRWGWRFWPFRLITSRPVLHGTWKAELRSNWVDPQTGKPIPPKDVYVVVSQTYSTIAVTMLFDISHSYSMSADIFKLGERQVLAYIYRSEAETLQQQGNPPHRGGAALFISTTPKVSFEGDYWTERLTKGRITSEGYSPKLYDSFADAQNGKFS
jgi:hypothetical protein